MIDTTRALRIVGSKVGDNGPARLVAVDGDEIVIRSASGKLGAFNKITGQQNQSVRRSSRNSALRLENEPIRTTERFYARRSNTRNGELRLQTTRPITSIGEIEVDVEGDKIVGVRLASS